MTTEPHFKIKNALAGIYGASASCVAFLLLLIYIGLTPVVPGDDASIRGAAILIGFIPPIWLVLFLYFFAVSLKATKRLRFAFIFQTVWVSLLSGLLSYVALMHEGWAVALPILAITFAILSVIIGVSSWSSTLAK
jgi:hypothetical protein